MSLGLGSAWATSSGISDYLVDQPVNGLPEDYHYKCPENVTWLALDTVNGDGRVLFHRRPLTWVVMGDRQKIEAAIRSLALGSVQVIDADGAPVP